MASRKLRKTSPDRGTVEYWTQGRRKKNSRTPRKLKPGRKEGYRSGLELDIARQLEERGISFTYESISVKYSQLIRNSYCESCGSRKLYKSRTYTPDFIVGSIILEGKGKLTSSERSKILAIKKCNPDLDIRLIFDKDNWLTTAHKMRYSGWAKKNGIPYSTKGVIPDEWIEDLRISSGQHNG